MFHPLPWDRVTWLWSAGVMLVLLACLLASIRWHRDALAGGAPSAMSAGAAYLCLALLVALPLTAPLGVRLSDTTLEIVRLGGRGSIDLRRIETLPKPVIAAIQGHATGGGCEIAMACHLRVMKETARIGQTESNLGIIPGYGGTQRLPRLIGRTKALEYLILGTQIPAPEALALGLVNRLAREGETLEEAKALARTIAQRAPVATRLIIECVDRGLNGTIEQGIEAEVRAFLEVLRTEDAAEGIQAFFTKRPPRFKGA